MLRFLFIAIFASAPIATLARTVGPNIVGPEDLVTIDALGYECISPAFFEEVNGEPALAFEMSGKIKLARTCLPEPCNWALTREELAQLTGTDPRLARFDAEWNDYYARYSDTCIRETNPVPNEVDQIVAQSNTFWEPFIGSTPIAPAIPSGSSVLTSATDPQDGSSTPILTPTFPEFPAPTRTTLITESTETSADDSSTSGSGPNEGILGEEDSVDIAAMPLSPNWVFLLSAIGLFWSFAQRNKAA